MWFENIWSVWLLKHLIRLSAECVYWILNHCWTSSDHFHRGVYPHPSYKWTTHWLYALHLKWDCWHKDTHTQKMKKAPWKFDIHYVWFIPYAAGFFLMLLLLLLVFATKYPFQWFFVVTNTLQFSLAYKVLDLISNYLPFFSIWRTLFMLWSIEMR